MLVETVGAIVQVHVVGIENPEDFLSYQRSRHCCGLGTSNWSDADLSLHAYVEIINMG